jgi:hypothetical protein
MREKAMTYLVLCRQWMGDHSPQMAKKVLSEKVVLRLRSKMTRGSVDGMY